MDLYLGMIILFGGNFQIRGMAYCFGQLLAISQNSALFSLIGTYYGGNGQTSFALPDLRGRTPIGFGQGPGLDNHNIGQMGGLSSVTLSLLNLPSHNHVASSNLSVSQSASTAAGTSNIPGATLVPAKLPKIGSGPGATQINGYAAQDNSASLASSPVSGSINISNTGGNTPVSIQNPYLATNYLIATVGIFPSRE